MQKQQRVTWITRSLCQHRFHKAVSISRDVNNLFTESSEKQLKQMYKLWCQSGEVDSNYCSFDNLFLTVLQNVNQKLFTENTLCRHVLLSLKGIFDVFLIVTGLVLLQPDIREFRTTAVCHSVRWWLMTLQRLTTRQHRELLTGFTFTEMTFQGTLAKECATRTQTADNLWYYLATLKYNLWVYNFHTGWFYWFDVMKQVYGDNKKPLPCIRCYFLFLLPS